MECKSCHREIDDNSKTCIYCGNPTDDFNIDNTEEYIYCTECGAKIVASSSYCNSCGKKVRRIEDEIEEQNIPNIDSEEIKKAEMFNRLDIISSAEYNQNINDNININNRINYTSAYKDNNLDRGTTLLIAIMLILFAISIGGVLIMSGGFGLFGPRKGKKTIMVYMIGSNLESQNSLATYDIGEMINSKFDLEVTDVVIYTGGAKQWQEPSISNEDHGVYHITADGIEKVKSFEKDKMGSSSTLSRFLNYAYNNYRADMYGLILWDHGGGPINGYGYDEFYKFDSLTLTELKQALDDSPFSREKLEFIGFDACLMSSVEVASTISNYSRYFVSSEENEPGGGWDYTFLESIKFSDDGKTIGKSVTDYYLDYYNSNFINGITIALIDLERIDKVETEINKLFSKLNDNMDSDFSYISRTRSNSKEFGKTSDTSYDLIDLYDFADKLPNKYSSEKEGLKSAINDAVVNFNTDINGANGLSIYFPYAVKNKFEKSIKTYKTFGFAEDYLKFASNFTSKLTGKRINTFSLDNITPVLNDDGSVKVTLSNDIIENYSKITYRLFEKLPNGNFVPRFQGNDYNLSGNTVTTSLTKKGITATDKEGNTIYLMAFEAERGVDYVKYLIPGTIEEHGDDYTSTPVFVHFVVSNNNPNGKIEGITKTEPDVDVSAKTIVDLDKVSSVIFMGTAQYKIFDEQGKYMQNWKVDPSEQVEMIEENLTDIKIEFKDLDIAKEYYCIFEIQDSQSNAYSTNPVKITK